MSGSPLPRRAVTACKYRRVTGFPCFDVRCNAVMSLCGHEGTFVTRLRYTIRKSAEAMKWTVRRRLVKNIMFNSTQWSPSRMD